MIEFDAFGITDRGRKRRKNEDQFLIGNLSKTMSIRQTSLDDEMSGRVRSDQRGHVLIVADGMGGAMAGERASSLAVETLVSHLVNIVPWFLSLDSRFDEDSEDELRLALKKCNDKILKESRRLPELQGMGTTLTFAYVLWPRLYVVHAGDSRCYLYRDRRLELLTRDHTVAQDLVEQGNLSPEEAEGTPVSHILTNVLGGDEDGIFTQVVKLRMQPGDLLLLATDGLTKHLSDDELLLHLRRPTAARELAENLVRSANAEGGTDNVTVVVARFSPETKGDAETVPHDTASNDTAAPRTRRAA